jgi:ABC-2 type transport system permease protein
VSLRTARKAARSGALWGLVFGIYIVSSAVGYASAYPKAAERQGLARSFGSNSAVDAIIGPAHQIGTVAGFVAWRTLGVVSIVGAVWALLTATRLLRGEEETGRWEVLLAGQTTRRRAAAQGIGGLAVGLLALWSVTAVLAVAVGRSAKVHIAPGAALYLTLAVTMGAAVFLAVGALASQLAATRRQAAMLSAAVLGVSYAVRMIADSGTGLGWLRWASPLGWVEELRPLSHPQPAALLPLFGLVVVSCVSAVLLAGARDLGASALPDRGDSPPHLRLLGGPAGVDLRLIRPAAIGWLAAIGVLSFVLGMVAKSAGRAIASASNVQQVLERLGGRGSGAKEYLGVGFLVVATLLTLIAAGQIAAARDEEATGRLDHLLVRPVGRVRWLAGRLVVTVALVALAGLTAGVVAWLGTVSQAGPLGLGQLVAAGLNLVPPALFVLGFGALVFGLWPWAAAAAAYAVLAWSFLIELLGGIIRANHWVLDTSVLYQMAPAPAVAPALTSTVVLCALGVGFAAAGMLAFRRRDLASA